MSQPLEFKLRRNLLITPVETEEESQTGYMVKQLESGEIFEFGTEEFFLCQCLDGEATLESISQKFEAEFGLSVSEDYLRQFFQQIGEFGLLERVDFGQLDGAPEPASTALDGQGQVSANDSRISHPPSNIESLAPDGDPPSSRSRLLPPVDHALESATAFNSARLAEDSSTNFNGNRDSVVSSRQFQPQRSENNQASLDVEGQSGRWYLGNPTPVLEFIDFAFSPIRPFMRFYVWLLIPAILGAGFLYIKNQDLMWQDLAASRTATPFILSIFVNLVTISLVSRLARGTVCHHFGGDVKEFGLRLRFGIILRFYIDASSTNRLDRRAKIMVLWHPNITSALHVRIWHGALVFNKGLRHWFILVRNFFGSIRPDRIYYRQCSDSNFPWISLASNLFPVSDKSSETLTYCFLGYHPSASLADGDIPKKTCAAIFL
jgi:hypothetical protein